VTGSCTRIWLRKGGKRGVDEGSVDSSRRSALSLPPYYVTLFSENIVIQGHV
jgi:hypothetical protein